MRHVLYTIGPCPQQRRERTILLSGNCVILSRHLVPLALPCSMFLGTSFENVRYVPYGPWPMKVTDTLAVLTVVS